MHHFARVPFPTRGLLIKCYTVKDVYYPLYSPTRPYYEDCKNAEGGYGGLFSVVFHSEKHAIAFYDAFDVLKGPSLGTNFTLWYVPDNAVSPTK